MQLKQKEWGPDSAATILTRLHVGQSEVRTPTRVMDFILSETSGPSVGPIRSSVQWVLGFFDARKSSVLRSSLLASTAGQAEEWDDSYLTSPLYTWCVQF